MVCRERWQVVVLITACVVGSAAVRASHSETRYRATASVLLNTRGVDRAFFTGGSDVGTYVHPDRAIANQLALMRSDDLAVTVARRLPEVSLDEARKVRVVAAGHSRVARISVTLPTPRGATALVQAYADAFVEFRRDLDRGVVAQALTRRQQSSTAHDRSVDRRLKLLQALQTGGVEVVGMDAGRGGALTTGLQRTAALSLPLGLLLALVFTMLLQRADGRVRSPRKIEAMLGAPQIGELSLPDEPATPAMDGHTSSLRRAAAADAVLSQLRYFRATRGPNVAVVSLDDGTLARAACDLLEARVEERRTGTDEDGARTANWDLELTAVPASSPFGGAILAGSDLVLACVDLERATRRGLETLVQSARGGRGAIDAFIAAHAGHARGHGP